MSDESILEALLALNLEREPTWSRGVQESEEAEDDLGDEVIEVS